MIERRDLRLPDATGTLFAEPGARRRPVIVLPGSEGGIPEHVARLLAESGGFTTLALAYFGLPGLPRRLVEVPLEIVDRAAAWLLEQPTTRPGEVGLMGGSKGAELALLAAAELPARFGPVVAYAPSSVAWAGVEFFAPDRRFAAGLFGTASLRSSWSLRASPVPFVQHPPGVMPRIGRRGVSVSRPFEFALRDDHATASAAIAVERTDGPILLVSGDEDHMWPATPMALAILQRLRSLGMEGKAQHVRFPNAGHRLAPIHRPHGIQHLSFVIDYGGNETANRVARTESWDIAVKFLQRELTP